MATTHINLSTKNWVNISYQPLKTDKIWEVWRHIFETPLVDSVDTWVVDLIDERPRNAGWKLWVESTSANDSYNARILKCPNLGQNQTCSCPVWKWSSKPMFRAFMLDFTVACGRIPTLPRVGWKHPLLPLVFQWPHRHDTSIVQGNTTKMKSAHEGRVGETTHKLCHLICDCL